MDINSAPTASSSSLPVSSLLILFHWESQGLFSAWWGCSLILFLCAFNVQGPKPSMSFVWMDSLICPGLNISTANQIIQICSLKQTNLMGFGLLHLSRILSDPFSHSRIVHILIKPRETWCLLKIKYCPWFAWRILWIPTEHLQGHQRQLMANLG